jgi:hypothetical protein
MRPLHRIVFLSTLAVSGACFAPIPAVPATVAVHWIPTDLVFHANPPVCSEFEVELSAEFSEPESSTFTVPGFYNGDAHFVLRFAPSAPSHWIYTTASSLPQLDNLTSAVHDSAAPARSRDPQSEGFP